jgi:hypothetical protein
LCELDGLDDLLNSELEEINFPGSDSLCVKDLMVVDNLSLGSLLDLTFLGQVITAIWKGSNQLTGYGLICSVVCHSLIVEDITV